MRPRAKSLGLVFILLAAVLSVSGGLAKPQQVSAHCPGGAGTFWAAGGRSVGANQSRGVLGAIAWTQGNVCSSGVSHSVSVCASGTCTGFVQTGWRYFSHFAEPQGYCERRSLNGTSYAINYHAISHSGHTYRFQHHDGANGGEWRCQIDGTTKTTVAVTWMAGMTRGSWMPVQGEAHAPHVQIGSMAPNKLSFTGLRYVNTASSLVNLDPTLQTPSSPYGIDKVSATHVRVWTNAH